MVTIPLHGNVSLAHMERLGICSGCDTHNEVGLYKFLVIVYFLLLNMTHFGTIVKHSKIQNEK